MDVLISVVALVVLAPLMLCIAAFIRVVSPGAVLFKQRRVGWGAEPFTILKFRTMRKGRSLDEHQAYVATLMKEEGAAEKPIEDSDLIPGGAFLRRFSLDELPQLINVLRGDMSIVGPRPDVLDVDQYEAWQLRRFEVLPGITGWWQVNGKNRLSFLRMIELDLEYVERMSFGLDVRILFKTLGILFGSNNS